jgi:enamine deaminase RidA (YjgF/YER057c/UK114 family)
LKAPLKNTVQKIEWKDTMSIDQKLQALQIELPTAAAPAAAYVMYVQTGNTVFLSGHIAKKEGKPWVGQLGKNMATDEGKLAARAIAIDLIATLKAACGGDLSRVILAPTSRNTIWSPTAHRN